MRKITRQKPVKSILEKSSNCRIRLTANLLLLELGEMTNKKCAYCETSYRLHEDKTPQIEHFYPKSKYLNLENHWYNLFWSCPTCNQKYKKDKFLQPNIKKRIIPLKPDNDGKLNGKAYNFVDWFIPKFKTGEIIPNKQNKDWRRAEWTIEIFGLNRNELLTARKKVLDKYRCEQEKKEKYGDKKQLLINYSYSFYIEYWLQIKEVEYQYYKQMK